jgi:hypothetical protein
MEVQAISTLLTKHLQSLLEELSNLLMRMKKTSRSLKEFRRKRNTNKW